MIEYAADKRHDPIGYLERALQNDGNAVPPHIRERVEHRIREYRAGRTDPATTPNSFAEQANNQVEAIKAFLL